MKKRNSKRPKRIGNPFPTPREQWGDYHVPSWTKQENHMFGFWLTGISSRLIYAEQSVAKRVNYQIIEFISKAKTNVIPYTDAIEQIKYWVVFSEEELKFIEEEAQKQGNNFGKFWTEKENTKAN